MRRVVPVILALLAAALLTSTSGAGPVPDPLVFPVVGPYRYTNDFSDPRPQGTHEGNDVLAPKKSIVVAVEDGKIKFWTTSARAGCMLYLYGASGTTYLYIHLNNDVTMANDNRGKCVPGGPYWPGLKDGQRVVAGQAIGYVGDSGDANGTPHLHFEVHPNDGGPANPFPYLNKATRLLFAAPPGSAVTLSLKGTVLLASATHPEDEGRDRNGVPGRDHPARPAQARGADDDEGRSRRPRKPRVPARRRSSSPSRRRRAWRRRRPTTAPSRSPGSSRASDP